MSLLMNNTDWQFFIKKVQMDSKIDHIKEQLMSGRITRREFAQRLMVLGIAGTSAGSLLTWAVRNAFAASPKRG